ncbi:NAD(P)H-hydrate dehydratase [Lentibacillus sp. N15]|uniref:NAD(P)H-hydrate dehydratase n=1 Tax=Lentibacillus songyuanensis TaxID=3136161 RepID=UPI0031BA3A9E
MYIVTAKEMYEMDRFTMQEIGLDERLLMENAGRAVACKVMEKIQKHDRMVVLVGAGNNGGDGFVIARTLLNQSYDVTVIQIVPDEKITGEAFYHKQLFVNTGGYILVEDDKKEMVSRIRPFDVIIDAMIGIGVHDQLREPVRTIVAAMNESKACVISVDIPTGLPADEGITNFTAVQADYTVVIEAGKMSLFLQHTAPYYGKWDVVSIGIPVNKLADKWKRNTWEPSCFQQTMPIRDPYAHKGSHGKGLAIGGSKLMPGSIAMTAKAALRAGAGLLTIGTTEDTIASIAPTCVEATYLITNNASISMDRYDAVAIGMGLGRDHAAETLVKQALQADVPIIIDADGLFHTKANQSLLSERVQPTIVTPHPGEMAMLLEISIAELLAKPFYYAQEFASRHQIYVVLKGKHTIITAPSGQQAVNQTGNQGLAKGGSGDVLSGIILAMLMQHENTFQALCNACFIHGAAADIQVQESHSHYDLVAIDVIAGIPAVYRTFL